jgi:hypothetical protein
MPLYIYKYVRLYLCVCVCVECVCARACMCAQNMNSWMSSEKYIFYLEFQEKSVQHWPFSGDMHMLYVDEIIILKLSCRNRLF